MVPPGRLHYLINIEHRETTDQEEGKEGENYDG